MFEINVLIKKSAILVNTYGIFFIYNTSLFIWNIEEGHNVKHETKYLRTYIILSSDLNFSGFLRIQEGMLYYLAIRYGNS